MEFILNKLPDSRRKIARLAFCGVNPHPRRIVIDLFIFIFFDSLNCLLALCRSLYSECAFLFQCLCVCNITCDGTFDVCVCVCVCFSMCVCVLNSMHFPFNTFCLDFDRCVFEGWSHHFFWIAILYCIQIQLNGTLLCRTEEIKCGDIITLIYNFVSLCLCLSLSLSLSLSHTHNTHKMNRTSRKISAIVPKQMR